MAQRIQIRRGTVAEWSAANPILAPGEMGYEIDTGKLKIGNGIQRWTSLASINSTGTSSGGSDSSEALYWMDK